MNQEIIGKHTIGQLISLYNRSAERCKKIAEMLEEISEQMDSARLAASEVRYAINDGDDEQSVNECKANAAREDAALAELLKKYDSQLATEAAFLAENTAFGLTKLDN